MRDFGRDFTLFGRHFAAGHHGRELHLEQQNRAAHFVLLWQSTDLFNPGRGVVDRSEVEFLSREEGKNLAFAPVRISFENLRMIQPNAVIRERSGDRSGAFARLELFEQRPLDELELGGAGRVLSGLIPNGEYQLFFRTHRSLLDLLDESQRVITGDERHVFVRAEVRQKRK
jgi:hypothetical protein